MAFCRLAFCPVGFLSVGLLSVGLMSVGLLSVGLMSYTRVSKGFNVRVGVHQPVVIHHCDGGFVTEFQRRSANGTTVCRIADDLVLIA